MTGLVENYKRWLSIDVFGPKILNSTVKMVTHRLWQQLATRAVSTQSDYVLCSLLFISNPTCWNTKSKEEPFQIPSACIATVLNGSVNHKVSIMDKD